MIEIIMSMDGWRLYMSTSVSKIRYSIGSNATTDRPDGLFFWIYKEVGGGEKSVPPYRVREREIFL